MSDPKKHHFVPEIYLQRFSINQAGDLYKLNVKPSVEGRYPKVFNKSQVCYEEDIYRYENFEYISDNQLEDPNHIEKKVFSYEASELTYLFDKVESKTRIFKSEFRRLLKIILSIKKRNPAIRDIFLRGDRDEEYMDTKVMRLRHEMLSEGFEEDEIERIIKKAKGDVTQQFADESYRKDMYRNSLLMTNQDIIQNEENALNLLLKWSPFIFSSDYRTPFITSDNPGYTIRNEREIYNTDLKIVDTFVFPLSPKGILVLKKNTILSDLNLYVDILRQKINHKDVAFYNAGSYHNCRKYILGNSLEQLIIASKVN